MHRTVWTSAVRLVQRESAVSVPPSGGFWGWPARLHRCRGHRRDLRCVRA